MAVALVGVTATIGVLTQSRPTIYVEDQDTGEIYYQTEATDGLTIKLRWIHSIELEPWEETYVVEGGELFLEELAIKSYGAGVEANPPGVTTVENGVIYTRGIHQEVEDLRYVHSHRTKHRLLVGDHLIDTPDISHQAFVTLKIKE
ncbi:MAG: DUF1850 domain-containing protein [Actinomycetaceae bacterium]|nr:DUF1850 domain-containing protein [Actinomycetaceae bacterium]